MIHHLTSPACGNVLQEYILLHFKKRFVFSQKSTGSFRKSDHPFFFNVDKGVSMTYSFPQGIYRRLHRLKLQAGRNKGCPISPSTPQ